MRHDRLRRAFIKALTANRVCWSGSAISAVTSCVAHLKNLSKPSPICGIRNTVLESGFVLVWTAERRSLGSMSSKAQTGVREGCIGSVSRN